VDPVLRTTAQAVHGIGVDGAADRITSYPVAPGAGCHVIVTYREPLRFSAPTVPSATIGPVGAALAPMG